MVVTFRKHRNRKANTYTALGGGRLVHSVWWAALTTITSETEDLWPHPVRAQVGSIRVTVLHRRPPAPPDPRSHDSESQTGEHDPWIPGDDPVILKIL